jgi:hypothetical protein
LLNHFNTLEELKEHGHSGIDERSKVRKFLKGIQYEPLNVCKLTITNSQELLQDFDKCVVLCKQFMLTNKTLVDKTLNVSQVQQSKFGGGRSQGSGMNNGRRSGKQSFKDIPYEQFKDAVVEDRYYKGKEYSTLTPKQKAKLAWLRSPASGARGGHGNDAKTLKRSIQALKAEIKALKAAAASNDSAGGDDSPSGVTNRNHPGLNRPAKGRKLVKFDEDA